ncbi:hypothetical protein FF1_027947 [Malus domestica]
MSVGRKGLQYNSSLNAPLAPAKGNIIGDSGTTLTLLPEEFYNKLELTTHSSRNRGLWQHGTNEGDSFKPTDCNKY